MGWFDKKDAPKERKEPVINKQKQTRAYISRKRYAAGDEFTSLSGWVNTDLKTFNSYIWDKLDVLRARARQAERDSSLAKGYIEKTARNIVGKGFTCKPRTGNDKLDRLILECVKLQSKARNFSAQGNTSRAQFETLAMRHLIRDGEVFIQRVRNYKKNDTGYTLRMIDPSQLFTQFAVGGGGGNYNNTNPNTGNRIIMGVEVDDDFRPVAYHFRNSNDMTSQIFTYQTGEITVVPAEDILHLFIPQAANQTRGVTWLHAALQHLEELRRFNNTAMTAARKGAAKVMTVQTQEGTESYVGDSTDDNVAEDDEDGTPIEIDLSGDEVSVMPAGQELKAHDFAYPHPVYEPFVNKTIELLANGLDTAAALTFNDYNGINYSAGQLMHYDEREKYKTIQAFVAERFHEWFYNDFINYMLVMGKFKGAAGAALLPSLPLLESLKKVEWEGKQFAPVDPGKSAMANQIMIDSGIKSRAQIIRERGDNPEEVFKELEAEKGMGFGAGGNPPNNAQNAPNSPENGEDEGEAQDGEENAENGENGANSDNSAD